MLQGEANNKPFSNHNTFERSIIKMAAFGQLTGRIGSDPELRFTNSGTPVINLSVANNRSVKVGEERQSIADWFKVTVFGRDAEVIAQYAKKGSALAFNGRLQNERYVDREGVSRTSTILVASSFEFVPFGKRNDEKANAAGANEGEVVNGMSDQSDSDIPF
jgi:single-strand DNA-binding protein